MTSNEIIEYCIENQLPHDLISAMQMDRYIDWRKQCKTNPLRLINEARMVMPKSQVDKIEHIIMYEMLLFMWGAKFNAKYPVHDFRGFNCPKRAEAFEVITRDLIWARK
jgi:hypothetical protein